MTVSKIFPNSSCRIVVVVSLLLTVFPISFIRAEDGVEVSVRTIEASEEVSNSDKVAEKEEALHVGEGLKDLAPRLTQLPFKKFRLLSSRGAHLSMKSKEKMELPNGQILSFRPIYMDEKRVGIWLSWKDGDGAKILDTRLYFDANETLMTGTDCSPGKGTILAIRANAMAPALDEKSSAELPAITKAFSSSAFISK